jgi:hypothetical protein
VVSSGLGYKLWIQHNAVLSEDNEVFDPTFWVEGFFLWQNVGRFFYCHRDSNKKFNADEEGL